MSHDINAHLAKQKKVPALARGKGKNPLSLLLKVSHWMIKYLQHLVYPNPMFALNKYVMSQIQKWMTVKNVVFVESFIPLKGQI